MTKVYFGGETDQSVPGVFNGDGGENIGIIRETTGLWAVRDIARMYFGGVGDVPVTK